jgi:hypothetical protein
LSSEKNAGIVAGINSPDTRIMPLTDAKIRNTKSDDKPIRLTDGGGLYLEVRPTGAKLWRYRYRIAGKENVFAIGEYFNDRRGEHISLDDARTERDKARALVKQGVHPAHRRQAERLAAHAENTNTFEAVAREWIAKKKPGMDTLLPSASRAIPGV